MTYFVKMLGFSSKIHPSVLINRDSRCTSGPLNSDTFFVGGAEDFVEYFVQ